MRGADTTIKTLILGALLPALALSAQAKEATDVKGASSAAPAVEQEAEVMPVPLQDYGPFKIEDKLKPRVSFWVDIYARYHSWEAVIHDIRYPWIIYGVIDNKKGKKNFGSERQRIIRLLTKLQQKENEIEAGTLNAENLKGEEKRVYGMFMGIPGKNRFAEAADRKRIRTQSGLRDNLVESLYVSGRYLPRMLRVFQNFGLPTEIAHLPFVESGFNKKAVSKVGASGIWQFMPYTGKLYLRVDEVVDERNDPMRAAEAAARLMQQNHKLLKEWPLAITAYNHGALGMANAVRETGTTSLAEIIERYEGKNFGFASENFYACFLAALHVTKNYEAYLGKMQLAKILEFDEFVMPHFVGLKTFLEYTKIDPQEFHDLNPALTRLVYEGKRYIPVGYTIRVPISAREALLANYEKIPAHLKHAEQMVDLSGDTSKPSPELQLEERLRAQLSSGASGGADKSASESSQRP